MPYLVALASIALLLQPRLRARVGERTNHPAWWPVGVFLVAVYGGYFGAGAGVMFVALAMVLTGLPLWHATLLKSALLGITNAQLTRHRFPRPLAVPTASRESVRTAIGRGKRRRAREAPYGEGTGGGRARGKWNRERFARV